MSLLLHSAMTNRGVCDYGFEHVYAMLVLLNSYMLSELLLGHCVKK